ncbi:MAG TPA: ATP-binding protein [Acidimicrobiales bacterium]|nr:ATP-binding protein [Acidimicrobiales bacterium]
MTTAFPFSAVVGQDEAKLALLLAAVEPRLGGVLLRGDKGTAKTTLARGLAGLLPDAPFVELPLGATEDRVVGSIDLAAALTGGDVRFSPGVLAAAHGGVLYVDEVNLLADHLVDVLLDVAASGTNRVEREGISHTHPSRFVLIGSMNPEEGDLRPQLLDRFGLAVDVTASSDPTERSSAVRRRLAFDAQPTEFDRAWVRDDDALRDRIAACQPAPVSDELTDKISALCARVGAESLRADLVICRGAAALAALEGRTEATIDDVRRVAPLALTHRRRRDPFDEPGIQQSQVDEALDAPPDADEQSDDGGAPESQTAPRPVNPDAPRKVVPLQAQRSADGATGRRSTVEDSRGRMIGDREPVGSIGSVAIAPTLRAAAGRPAARPDEPQIQAGDLREAVRERRAGNLVILAVDASGSMGAERRMEAAKGAAVSLLLDAYQRRDKVALVTFRGDSAEVALRPTGSVEVARARLGELSTGGRTPLAAGLTAAFELATAGNVGNTGHRPLIVVVSDGRATSGPKGSDPLDAAWAQAAAVRRRSIPAVVIDVEEGPTRLGLSAKLAEAMGARYLTLQTLSAGELATAVREAVRG